MNRLEKLPVPILPTFVGALTLSNVYAGFGYSWLRHFMMWTAAVILICYIVKLVRFPKTCLEEYKAVVPGSLYAGFSMVTMILGSYFFELGFSGGKFIWGAGLVIHSVHILVFTVRNILMKRDIDTFVPSWFVTYNGIMVSCVTGAAMNAGKVLTVVTYYGIAVYVLLIPFMIWRLMKVEVKPAVYHTMAVLLAPCSLCVVSVLNILENPNRLLVTLLYLCVLASLLFIIIKLPAFFSFPFAPGFAGMTFPMAIGIVASTKMGAFLTAGGQEALGNAVTQLAGFQTFLTTMIIGYVLLRFLMMFMRIEMKPVS